MKSKARPPRVRAGLKKLGNPYASLQIDLVEASEQSRAEVAGLDAAQRTYVRRLENPYAAIEVAHEEPRDREVETPRAVTAPAIPLRVSKEVFRRGARRVFRMYIPALEGGRLRTHHKDFITRNEDRSPEQRAALLQALQRYDLSDLRISGGHFNRERDLLTEDKLRAIERSVMVHQGR